MSKYIEKSIENDMGYVNNCWEVISGNFTLNYVMVANEVIEADSSRKNKGTLRIVAWRDVQAKLDGKKTADQKVVEIPLEQIPSYESFFNDIASYLVNDINSPFKDGVIKDTNDLNPS